MKRRILFTALLYVIAAASASAQAFSTAGWWGPAEEKFSPVVRPDGTLTFRVKAAGAKDVKLLFGEWDIVPQVSPSVLSLQVPTSTSSRWTE